MTPLIAGIDGGQSSTTAVVIDASGTVIGRASAGPSDHVGEPPDSPRAARACELALVAALAAAGLPPDTPLAAAGIGMSGYEGGWHGREPVLHAQVVSCAHDAVTALVGALAERPGAVVIAGTGSVAYAERPNGESTQAGGYGYLFGDEGSSFWIARTAIAGAMHASERSAVSGLGEAAIAFFECDTLRGIARAFALSRITRPQLAGFARVVHNAARLGNRDARTILDRAVVALAELAAIVADRVVAEGEDPLPVALAGGGFNDDDFRALVATQIGLATRRALVVPARYDPTVGAALFGAREAGITVPAVHE
jgi:glucosamine kinase